MSLATVKARILDDGTRKRLNAAADACAGKSARLEEGFRLAGVRFLRDTQREFKKLSRRERRGWKKLSPVTVLQRRRGRGKKIEDWDDIERRRSEIAILNDSGRLAASLSPGATGNVLKVKRLSVECGTNVSYADTHQRGKRSTFEFDEGQFEKNVKKILPGKKPKKTASGKKSRAKRNWNTMYCPQLAPPARRQALQGSQARHYPQADACSGRPIRGAHHTGHQRRAAWKGAMRSPRAPWTIMDGLLAKTERG